MNPELRAALTETGGVASRRELIARGVSDGTLRRAARAGHVIRMTAGLYRLPGLPDDPSVRMRTALAHAGRDSALSHVTAANVWGWETANGLAAVHVSVPHGIRRPGLSGVVVHQSRWFDPIRCSGWPVTRPRRTLIDLALTGDVQRFRFAAAQAVDQGAIALSDLLATEEVGGDARGVWRMVGQEVAAGAASGGEAAYWRLVADSTLPLPELNVPIHAGGRLYRVDVLWRDLLLVAEIDGRRFHTRRGDFENDALRQNDLQTLGLVVARFPVSRVLVDPRGVLTQTEELLMARAAALGLPLRRRSARRRPA